MLAAQGLSGTIVGVSPGAAFGSAKRWFPDRFAAAAVAVLAGREGAVVLFGGNQEVELATQVAALITQAGRQAINLAGKTSLREFIDLTAGCDLSLTNDSGAMHISYAVGTPSVTVFGSTDHLGTGPVGPLARVVRQPVDCSPCKLRECPIDHRCMTRVEANEVALVAIDLLK
jgi:heptosyltransferase-2